MGLNIDSMNLVNLFFLHHLKEEKTNYFPNTFQMGLNYLFHFYIYFEKNHFEKAKTNAFAKLMLSYGAGTPAKQGNPLRTSDGVPFLKTALDAIKDEYGSVEKYLKTEIGLSSLDIAQLRARYTY